MSVAQPRTQLATYLVFAGLALASAVVLSMLAVPYPHPSQAASLKLVSIVPVLALGCVGVWLLSRVHVPTGMERSDLRGRIGVPLLLGVVFGLIAVGLDWGLGLSKTIAARLEVRDIHLAAPYSLLAYTAGGIVVESLFRFVPLGVVTFLVVKLITRGRWLQQVFIAVAIVSCALEPLTQVGILTGHPAAMVAVATLIYLFGLTASWQLWRYGVAAPLIMRLAFYGVWHLSLGPLLSDA